MNYTFDEMKRRIIHLDKTSQAIAKERKELVFALGERAVFLNAIPSKTKKQTHIPLPEMVEAKALRQKLGLSVAEVSKQTLIPEGKITSIEYGYSKCKERAKQILDFLSTANSVTERKTT